LHMSYVKLFLHKYQFIILYYNLNLTNFIIIKIHHYNNEQN
jgi:hypothetical protein